MCLPIGSVILFAVILAVYGGVGAVHPVENFGRFVAPLDPETIPDVERRRRTAGNVSMLGQDDG